MPHRFEVSASGLDDGLVGLTSDPLSEGFPQGPGLRIPAVLPSDDGNVLSRPRYLFCLSTRVIRARTKLTGLRQGLTIGMDFNNGTPPVRPIELNVTTPGFRFVDGNVSWHLVLEKDSKMVNREPSTNGNNWAFRQADGSAMLYETFTNAVVQPVTGAPVLYMQGLTAYAPPVVYQNWMPIDGNLFTFYDIRFPWNASRANNDLNYEIDAHTRVSLYASVLQTNPQFRTPGPGGNTSGQVAPFGTPPEEAFITAYTFTPNEGEITGPIYWRIFGSLIWEDQL